jgi:hypothetical protein
MNFYAYTTGVSGFGFGPNSGVWDYVWADTIAEALAIIRLDIKSGQVSVRRAGMSEWDCDNFTLAGHYPHQ